jgi:molybdenum cofactor synthesis domain-containing protein
VLAVGSELLSGQVVNTNAARVSAALGELGFGVVAHLTVDDIEDDIVAAFDVLAPQASLIVVTGGLGPTSDDLTRDAVARWCGASLAFDVGAWDHVAAIFARRQMEPPAGNRQQCFFPRGATVLTNAAGTANAFRIHARERDVIVLPGPPREIETVWREHIVPWLASRIPPAARMVRRSWRTIGRGESHIAETVVPLLQGQGVEVAYRAHAPYIELKLRFPATDAARFQPLIERVNAALSPWLYERDEENTVERLAARVAAARHVTIYDGATDGGVLELLASPLRAAFARLSAPARPTLSAVSAFEEHAPSADFLQNYLEVHAEADLALAVAGHDADGTWSAGVRSAAGIRVGSFPALYRGDELRSRNFQAIAALAAKAWLALLAETES